MIVFARSLARSRVMGEEYCGGWMTKDVDGGVVDDVVNE
jgi:hypothetical protein